MLKLFNTNGTFYTYLGYMPKAGGEEISKVELAHISPLLFSHVIPNGTYRFREINRSDDEIALNTPK